MTNIDAYCCDRCNAKMLVKTEYKQRLSVYEGKDSAGDESYFNADLCPICMAQFAKALINRIELNKKLDLVSMIRSKDF